jgi:excisionase family DNA binding protein
MEQLLTREEVAALIRKPEWWLRYAERQQVIPFVRVGRHIRYRASDVEQWLEAHRGAPKPQGGGR